MPHPCEVTPDIPECVELAEKLAPDTATLEALETHAPAVMERLDAALAHVGTWVEATEAFAGEQAPLLVQEMIYWGIASAGFRLVMGVALILLGWAAYKVGRAHWEDWTASHEDSAGFCMFFTFAIGIVAPFIGTVVIALNATRFIKPIVAPRLYLVEYFRYLMQ